MMGGIDKVNTARRAFTACIVLLLLAAGPLAGQETQPLVGFVPVESGEGATYLESLNSSLTDTLELTVRFLGSYRVRRIRDFEGEKSGEALQGLAARGGYDTIVFGSTTLLEDGRVRIRLSAYNARENGISARQTGVAESMLDTFSTTDRLVASLVEGFTDTRVEYGSIRFEYAGVDTDLDVYVDDTIIGTNVRLVPRMVAGRHSLRVERSVEDGPVYFNRTVEIAAETENAFTIEVPYLSREESSALREIDRKVSYAWGNPSRSKEVDNDLSQAVALLEESKSVGAEKLREAYRQRREAASSVAAAPATAAPHTMGLYGLSRDEELEFPLVSLASQWKNNRLRHFLPFRTIDVDGEVDDWDGIEPYATDVGGDSSSNKVGTDLRALYLAMDEKYTYVRIDTEEGRPGRDTNFWYVLSFWKPFLSDIEYSLQVHGREPYQAEVTKYDRTNDSHPSIITRANKLRMGGNHIEARYLSATILEYLDQEAATSDRYEYFTPVYFLVGYESQVRDRMRLSHNKSHIIYRKWR